MLYTMRLFGIIFTALLIAATSHTHELRKRQSINVQNPPAFQALDQLRGSKPLNAAEVQQLMATAVPGVSYPILAYIPQTSFSCSSVRQPGFYADLETRCQVFRRCEPNNPMFSFICPNTTIFNQISLVCDYWYNVQCENNAQFVDYSNPRIYIQNARLLDDNGNGVSSGDLQSGGQSNFQQQHQIQLQTPAIYASGQLHSGRHRSSLYGSTGQSGVMDGSQMGYGQGGQAPSAYTEVFAGSYTPSQRQIPFGNVSVQQSSTYPVSSSSQLQYPSSQYGALFGQQQQQQSYLQHQQQQIQVQAPGVYASGQLQSGQQTSSLYGPTGQSGVMGGSQMGYGQGGQGAGYEAAGSSAYGEVFAGSHMPSQIQISPVPVQQSSTYPPSSSSQMPSSQYGSAQFGQQQQQQLPHAAEIPSLPNKLLANQDDASERVNDVLTTQVPVSDSSSPNGVTSK